MPLQKRIKEYIATQIGTKNVEGEMQQLHHIILALMPTCKLWFLDGIDEKGKAVSNPNIGYGFSKPLNMPMEKPKNSIKSV